VITTVGVRPKPNHRIRSGPRAKAVSGRLWPHLRATATEMALGLAAGTGLGLGAGNASQAQSSTTRSRAETRRGLMRRTPRRGRGRPGRGGVRRMRPRLVSALLLVVLLCAWEAWCRAGGVSALVLAST
jgi:ABC-type nitrate/sulfonate/bicarbonate transport system permease component